MRPTGESARLWLLGVANNLLRNHRRSLRRYRAALVRVTPAAAQPDPADDVAGRLADERRMRRVLALVSRLPQRDQEVLALCAWSELTYQEAADVLGIPVGTVRSRLARARTRLAELDGNAVDTPDTEGVKLDRASETTVEPGTAPAGGTRRWRRIAVAAAVVAAGFGIATPLVLGGDGTASATTAVRTADGDILITVREGKNPKELERRLNDLVVTAVVDFLETGYRCDPARSAGWVGDPPGEDLFTWAPAGTGDSPQLVLDPDELVPGQTAVFEFQIDEAGDEVAASVRLRMSTSEVGPCVPIRDGSIVDAEGGIAGG